MTPQIGRKVPDNPNTTKNNRPHQTREYPALWDWGRVERILLVRLRSIGDTVLTTPAIIALRRFLPHAQIDVLLEDWVAPILDGFTAVDNVIAFNAEKFSARFKTTRMLRAGKYDVAYNLHGGATSALMTWFSGARYRVGFGHYRNKNFYTQLAIPAAEFWGSTNIQSAEQQLAMLGWTGVPVSGPLKTCVPKTYLQVTAEADHKVAAKLKAAGIDENESFALFHPAAAFSSKEWPAEKFARAAEYLSQQKNIAAVAVAAAHEEEVLRKVKGAASVPVHTFSDLSLPEITALAARARLFAGNDSGIAHIAAAVETPCVVIFGSSNIEHWRPYTDTPNEVVSSENGIENISVESVVAAIEKVLHS
jgi:heptosyltransferase-3